MTPLKTQKHAKNRMFFGEKFYKNILSYFSKIFGQIFVEFGQKQLIYMTLAKNF